MSEIPYLKKKNKYGTALVVDREPESMSDDAMLDQVVDELSSAISKKDRAGFKHAFSAFLQMIQEDDA